MIRVAENYIILEIILHWCCCCNWQLRPNDELLTHTTVLPPWLWNLSILESPKDIPQQTRVMSKAKNGHKSCNGLVWIKLLPQVGVSRCTNRQGASLHPHMSWHLEKARVCIIGIDIDARWVEDCVEKESWAQSFFYLCATHIQYPIRYRGLQKRGINQERRTQVRI